MKHSFRLIATLLALVLSCLFFIGCKDDPEVEPNPLTADAGPDQTVPLGTLVSLDGSNSRNAKAEPFTFQWVIASRPEGSTANLVGATNDDPSFQPDKVGVFEIDMTITYKTFTKTDRVRVTVTPAQSILITQDISTDRVLENIVADPAVADYIMDGDISVYNAKLTIRPGVRILMRSDARLTINGDAALVTEGTPTQKVVFYGAQDVQGNWDGIVVFSNRSENQLYHTEIWNAGRVAIANEAKAGLYFNSFSGAKLKGVKVAKSGGHGLYALSDVELREFAENNFAENNALAGVSMPVESLPALDKASLYGARVNVHSYSLNEGAAVTWKAIAADYYFHGILDLNSPLVLEAGAKLQFGNMAGIIVQQGAYLKAVGTAAAKIEFKGVGNTAGLWKGIAFLSNSEQNTLHHVLVQGAGGSDLLSGEPKANVIVNGPSFAKLNLKFSTLSQSGGYGLYVAEGAELMDFAAVDAINNTLAGAKIDVQNASKMDVNSNFTGNGQTGVYVDGERLDQGTVHVWKPLKGGATYKIVRSFEVATGWELQASTVVEFQAGTMVKIDAGYIKTMGTSTNRVVLRGATPNDKGTWGGILVYSNDTRSELLHTDILGGGGQNGYEVRGNLVLDGNYAAYLKIQNCKIANSSAYGIFAGDGATLVQSGNTYENNSLSNIATQ